MLSEHAHRKEEALSYQSIVFFGYVNYYPRFGYQQADGFGIELPFDVPSKNYIAVKLTEGRLGESSGMVVYLRNLRGEIIRDHFICSGKMLLSLIVFD